MNERKEPVYLFTEKQTAEKSELARRFLETRTRLNENVEKADNFLVKRFYNIDHNTYLEGAIPAKYKEMMGLVVSAGLRCDDCILHQLSHHSVVPAGGDTGRAGRGAERGAGGRRKYCDSTSAKSVCGVGGVVWGVPGTRRLERSPWLEHSRSGCPCAGRKATGGGIRVPDRWRFATQTRPVWVAILARGRERGIWF